MKKIIIAFYGFQSYLRVADVQVSSGDDVVSISALVDVFEQGLHLLNAFRAVLLRALQVSREQRDVDALQLNLRNNFM